MDAPVEAAVDDAEDTKEEAQDAAAGDAATQAESAKPENVPVPLSALPFPALKDAPEESVLRDLQVRAHLRHLFASHSVHAFGRITLHRSKPRRRRLCARPFLVLWRQRTVQSLGTPVICSTT